MLPVQVQQAHVREHQGGAVGEEVRAFLEDREPLFHRAPEALEQLVLLQEEAAVLRLQPDGLGDLPGGQAPVPVVVGRDGQVPVGRCQVRLQVHGLPPVGYGRVILLFVIV